MYCRRCGYENKDDALICVNCGKTVKVAAVRVQADNEKETSAEKASEKDCTEDAAGLTGPVLKKKAGKKTAVLTAAAGAANAVLQSVVFAAGL